MNLIILQFSEHDGPLQLFITAGRCCLLQAFPAGLLVPYQTHWSVLYLTPCPSHGELHYNF